MPGTLLSACVAPFLGKIMQSGIRPQYLDIVGFFFFAIFGFLISHSNLDTGNDYFFIPLLFRGSGAGLLVVPLTALAVSDLKPADIPQGAALNNMMRQMGGSFGIALMNTYIAHRVAFNRNLLVSHINTSDYLTQQRLLASTQYFISKGSDCFEATKQALVALENSVTKQTFLLSYMNAFSLIALTNACCIVLVLVTLMAGKKRNKIKI